MANCLKIDIDEEPENKTNNEILSGENTDKVTDVICKVLKEENASNIVTINISHKTKNWVDIMIIATSKDSDHCLHLCNMLQHELRRQNLCDDIKVEKNEGNEWVIMSTKTVVVELMTDECREYIDLEHMWVLKKSKKETDLNEKEEAMFMYDNEEKGWDDD